MLSGENGILKHATDSKEKTTVAGEKEQVELAYISAAVKNLGGNVTGQNLQDELDASVGDNKTTVTGTSTLKVKFEDTQNVYKVSQDGKVEKKNSNPNVLEISELYENASTYFGWDVINYTETLDASLNYMKWQLFYAGALDGETEERIYLISKEYVKNTDLPAKNGAMPISIEGSEYKAKFSTYKSNIANINDGILPQYTNGSDLITELKLKKLNSKYFNYLTNNSTNSTNPNMMAVAYMMDVITWNKFAASSKGYAEYAIGGPTIELLFTSYNKYKGLSTFKSQVVNNTGYQMTTNIGNTYYDTSSITQTDLMYSASSISQQALGYWISSPSNNNSNFVMYMHYTGSICGMSGTVGERSYHNENYGFRPIILLDSNYALEKTKDLNGNDAFKIVEK